MVIDMKSSILLCVIVLSGHFSFAQNRINYSQYMHNHQVFNPGYFELDKDFGGSIMYRSQWSKIEGAPTNAIANLFGKVGQSSFGLQLLYDQITIFKHIEVGASYNYAIRLGVSTLWSFGVKASYNQRTADYSLLQNITATDPYLSGVIKQSGLNLGFGTFVRHPNWHVGFGAPYLFNNNNIESAPDLMYQSTYQHFFLTGGYRIFSNRHFDFYPTSMIKWAKGSPLNASLDVNFLVDNRFFFSTGYRTDNAVILQAGVIFWNSLKLVYSYDLGLGKYSRFGGMTHELSLGYGMEVIQNHFLKRKYVKRNRTPKGGRTPRRWRR